MTDAGAGHRAMTIKQFCETYHMSQRFFYSMVRQGRGPEMIKIGPQKTLISFEAAERWLMAREKASRSLSEDEIRKNQLIEARRQEKQTRWNEKRREAAERRRQEKQEHRKDPEP